MRTATELPATIVFLKAAAGTYIWRYFSGEVKVGSRPKPRSLLKQHTTKTTKATVGCSVLVMPEGVPVGMIRFRGDTVLREVSFVPPAVSSTSRLDLSMKLPRRH
ncbi:hypothetical protein MRX96_059252 [Rhipicephalus microplus]